MKQWHILSYGALGGICPILSEKASYYVAFPEADLPEMGLYIGMAMFAVLGGIMATAFGSKEVKAAVVAGIAAPAIVAGVVNGQSDGANEKNRIVAQIGAEGAPTEVRASALWTLGVGVAHAQARSTMRDLTDHKAIRVETEVQGGLPSIEDLRVYAISNDPNKGPEIVGILSPNSGPQEFFVREGTVGLLIAGERIEIQDAEEIRIEITTSKTFASELIWALGGKRNSPVQSIQRK